MPHGFELTTKVMGPYASLHADQASRNIGKRAFELMSRPLLPQYNRAATVESDHMKAVLAQVDADGGNGRLSPTCAVRGGISLFSGILHRVT